MGRPPTNEELIRAEREIEDVRMLSERYGVPGIDLNQICLRTEDLELVPRAIAEHRLLLPVLVRDDRLFVAMRDPTDGKAIDELEFVTARKVLAYVASPTALARVVPAAYDALGAGRAFYVGPTCPEEIQERMGVEEDLPPPAEPIPASVRSPKLEEAAAKDDLSFNEFGSIEDDLSVVVHVDVPTSVGARRGTVLVVDDEADIRLLLKRVLESRGHRVLEADRGLEALRMVKAHMPDLLILDAMLPEVHGFEIARRIKGSKRYGHIPIVMVSAVYKGMRVAADVKESYGVDAYVEKPFRMQQIVDAVEEALARAALEGGPPEQRASELADRSAEVASLLASGIESYRRGDTEGAIVQLRDGLAIDPLAFRLRFHLGLLYGRKGLLFEAIAELEMAAQQNGKYFPCWKNLAVLYQKAGFRNKALEAWKKAGETAPNAESRVAIDEHVRALG